MICEGVREEETSSQTMAMTFQCLKRVYKHPVLRNKDGPGSVVQDTFGRGGISLRLSKAQGMGRLLALKQAG